VVGEPVLVAGQVATYLQSANFSASRSLLAYRPGKVGLGISTLAWFDRQGKELGAAGEPGMSVYLDVALSPDGSTVAESRADANASVARDLAAGLGTRCECAFHV
jgi:hypothetical protein